MNHGEYLTPYPLRIWDAMIDYDFDIQHFQGDGNGLMELYEIVMEYQHGIAYPALEITNLLLIILLQKFEITVDMGGMTNINGTPMTLEDRMNAIIIPPGVMSPQGWDNLEHDFSRLSTAVSWTLERLGVDYTVNERCEEVPSAVKCPRVASPLPLRPHRVPTAFPSRAHRVSIAVTFPFCCASP